MAITRKPLKIETSGQKLNTFHTQDYIFISRAEFVVNRFHSETMIDIDLKSKEELDLDHRPSYGCKIKSIWMKDISNWPIIYINFELIAYYFELVLSGIPMGTLV